MAGQNLTAEQIAAAGSAAQGTAQEQNQNQAAGQAASAEQKKDDKQALLTQEQFNAVFNSRWAENMGKLETELGLQPGGLKDFVAAHKAKPKQAAQSGETLTGADLKIARMEALMEAGIPSKQIPMLLQHLNLPGKTREEIAASVKSLIDLKLLAVEPEKKEEQQQQQNNAATGAGNTGVGANAAKKIWTEDEIRGLRTSGRLTDQIMEEIRQAAQEDRIK